MLDPACSVHGEDLAMEGRGRSWYQQSLRVTARSLPAIVVISGSKEARDSDSEGCCPWCAYAASHGGRASPVVRTVVDTLCTGMVLLRYLHSISLHSSLSIWWHIRLRSCLCGRVSDCTPHLWIAAVDAPSNARLLKRSFGRSDTPLTCSLGLYGRIRK